MQERQPPQRLRDYVPTDRCPKKQSQDAPAAQLAALFAACSTCSHPKGRCLLFRQVAAEKIQLIHLHAQLIPTCSPIISQRLDLTSQKAEGLKEGFSLEANALTGADAAMLPCITRQAIASEHP